MPQALIVMLPKAMQWAMQDETARQWSEARELRGSFAAAARGLRRDGDEGAAYLLEGGDCGELFTQLKECVCQRMPESAIGKT